MPDTRISLEYQCPVCGAPAVAGKHFCPTPGSTKETSQKPRHPRNASGVVRLVALTLAAGLLWVWLGPMSLLGVGVAVLLLLFWENRKGR